MSTPGKDYKTPTKTPKKKSYKPTTPATPVPNSPSADSGIQHRVSDILVTFHQCVQTWELNNTSSLNTASTLCNLYTQWDSMKEDDLLDLDEICKRKYYVKLANTREDLLKQLKEHQQKLELLMKKMMRLVNNLKAIYYLGLTAGNVNEDNEQLPVFNKWTANEFYQKIKLVFDAYTKEYYLKLKFYNKFFAYRVEEKNANGTNVLSQCLNYWLHQPYLDEHSRFLFEAMLVEADLK